MNEREEGAEQAATRLAFESQFSGLREVMEGVPGITGTLPQLAARPTISRRQADGWLPSTLSRRRLDSTRWSG